MITDVRELIATARQQVATAASITTDTDAQSFVITGHP